MAPTLTLALLLALAGTSHALTHLCAGPASRGEAAVLLQGTAVVDGYWGAGRAAERKRIGWTAKLVRDVVTWYELSADGASMPACSGSRITLCGGALDRTDYRRGTVFVIDRVDWERLCGEPRLAPGVAEEDDVLFYEITDAPAVGARGITLAVRMIPGRSVVPEVELAVADGQGEPAPAASDGDFEIFRGGAAAAAAVARQEVMLRTAERKVVELKVTKTVTKGVVVRLDASVDARIRKFKLKRLRKLRFTWEQGLAANAGASVTVTKEVKKTAKGRLLQRPVPGFGFRTRKIPFVGRASAGAFVRVDWVLEIAAKTTMTAAFDIRREIRRKVDAKIFPPSFSTKKMSPRTPNAQSSTLTFGADATINGFAGVRPALGIEVALGKKNAGGNIGVKLGIEVETKVKAPPFKKFTAGGKKIGVCDRCHRMQGFLGVRVKDLTLQLEEKKKVKKETVLVAKIFGARIATICAIPKTCPVPDTPPPTPVTPPTSLVTPPPTPVFRKCSKTKPCRKGFRCVRRGRRRVCRRELASNKPCGTGCTRCHKGGCPRKSAARGECPK